jgi:chemotaxis protein methyltransferase CheR
MNLLAHEGEAASTDLILFRNVAIYLAPETAAQAYAQFARQLSPGGILVTGKAETPPRSLPLARVTHCIFRRL